MWLPGDVGRATRLVPRARLGRSGGTTIPWDQGTRGVSVGWCTPALLAAEWGGHLGWLGEGWGWGTHGGLAPGAGACWCMGPQGCGAMGRWGHRTVGLTGCKVTGWEVWGVHAVQCGWLGMGALGMGQGWLGCRCPVPAVWLDATWHRG